MATFCGISLKRQTSMLLVKSHRGIYDGSVRRRSKTTASFSDGKNTEVKKKSVEVKTQGLQKLKEQSPNVQRTASQKPRVQRPRVASDVLQRYKEQNPHTTAESLRTYLNSDPAYLKEQYERRLERRREELWARVTAQTPSRLHKRTFKYGAIYSIHIGSAYIYLPVAIASAWGLNQKANRDLQITVKLDVADSQPHPQRYALSSIETDAAARLGLQVQHAAHEPVWLRSERPIAVALTNAWVDWLEGRISDPDTHSWPWDRFPFLGPLSLRVSRASWDEVFADPVARRALVAKGEAPRVEWRYTQRKTPRSASETED